MGRGAAAGRDALVAAADRQGRWAGSAESRHTRRFRGTPDRTCRAGPDDGRAPPPQIRGRRARARPGRSDRGHREEPGFEPGTAENRAGAPIARAPGPNNRGRVVDVMYCRA